MARDRERKCPPRLGSVRPSLAVNYTAHVADSQRFLLQGPAVLKNKRSRKIAKSGGLRFHSELPTVLASGKAAGGVGGAGAGSPMLALSYLNEASLCPTALT